jgi:hypothetical protein
MVDLRVSVGGSGIGVITATPAISLKSHILVVRAGLLTLVDIVTIPLWTSSHVADTIILVTTKVIIVHILAVFVDSISPSTPQPVGTTVFNGLLRVPRTWRREGIVTETLAIMLKADVFVGATFVLARFDIEPILLRAVFQVTGTVVLITTNEICMRVFGVLVDSVSPATSQKVGATIRIWLLTVNGSRCGIGVVTATPAIVLQGNIFE